MINYLLISNLSHPGIKAVASGYKKAFEYLGVGFEFLGFRDEPACSVDEANAIIQWKIANSRAPNIIFVQPSFLNARTFLQCSDIDRAERKIYAINTEDPYSTEAMMQFQMMFDKVFSNEITVAERLKFEYLPLAFDSLQPYKERRKDVDIGFISTFYGNRFDYLKEVNSGKILKKKDIPANVLIAGSLAPMLKAGQPLDLSIIKSFPEMLPRYKELESYSRCTIVLNPHRSLNETGKSFFNLSEGINCRQLFKEAHSPNPRFFDAIANGCICLSDAERTECMAIIDKYVEADKIPEDLFILPSVEDLSEGITKRLNLSRGSKSFMTMLASKFRQNETYIHRAKKLLEAINAKS